MKFILINLVFIFQFYSSLSSSADEIESLPGLAQKLTFKQYSGYLSGGQDIHLHYWFVESQGNPEKDPLILWLNGGPGCSSLDGLLKENGPFRVGSDGQTVTIDTNSWNTLANVLYLESPVGVGFSYSENQSFVNTDDLTAQINRIALQDFFKKFPQYSKSPFYITGESYAGIYIPTLAVEIYRSKADFNLKGLAIGNGLLDIGILRNSQLELALAHGFAEASAYDKLTRNCCKCSASGRQCDFFGTTECTREASNVHRIFTDPYNVFNDCNDELQYERVRRVLQAKFGQVVPNPLPDVQIASKPNCPFSNFTAYLNRPEVRKALHVSDRVKQWRLCGGANYRRKYDDMKAQVKELVEVHKVPTFIIYNGDLDMVCDFLGDQRFVESLGYKLKDKYNPWTVGGRIGGFVKRYEGITYTTVRGAGHMVPTDQPEAGLAIVKELLGIKKLN